MAQTDSPAKGASNDQLGLVPQRAKVGDALLCEQMQALQARAAKLRPVDLQDADLDAADPHTRLFLLAEYWHRKATTAREQLARFTPLRARGVVDADDNLDCWDTAPFELCHDHVAALNEKDPAAMWRVVDLYAVDLGPNVAIKRGPTA